MKYLSGKADIIAAGVSKHYAKININALRDHCDIATGGALDTIELDILTEMVETRLEGLGVTVAEYSESILR
jgi:hypothetical protein